MKNIQKGVGTFFYLLLNIVHNKYNVIKYITRREWSRAGERG